MASSSSSPQIKYDVFLSFRGEDTRHNFTSHLHAALLRKKINPFIDCQLEKGDEISPSLLNAIEASKIAVIVFSEGYAFSSWCLDELMKIIECKKKYGQIVIPIFYNVDPSSVRNQSGIFGDAFMNLEQRCNQRLEVEKLQRWRSALKDAADIAGSHCYGIRPESELIEEIANDILKRLNDSFESDDAYLVGAGSCIAEIESLLRIESTDVCSLGIWGIGGIGKTSIAEAIFSKISNHFESSYFLEDVRETERNGGLQKLQQKLFCNMLEDRNIKTGFHNLNFQIKRLNRKKILIVFDNVTSLRQIEFLIKHHDCLAPGSRIIVTTRDKQILENCRMNTIYEMKELSYTDALKLFSRHAFKQYLPDESYVELSKKAIKYAHGVPLALKVLGCSLYTRSMEEWESALRKLKSIPYMEIQDVLKISYDDLDDNEKDIFLDIVCFFIGGNRDLILQYLNASGFFGEIGIRTLLDKCLITMSHNRILVHELLQKMGKEIIRQECIKDPGKRSRLYQPEDIYEVLTENREAKAIEGISLNMYEVQEIQLHPLVFTNMPNLRYLRLYGINKCNVSCFEGRGFRKVRYFEWHGYPLKSLPLNINPEFLVSLRLPDGNVEQLWNGVQNLVHLKEIDLQGCDQLKELPNLSRATKLETLDLEFCSSLIEFPEISSCNILSMKLYNCKKLESFPNSLCKLKSLQDLDLSDCLNLQRLPDKLGDLESLEELNIVETGIAELPSSIGFLSRLRTLRLGYCKILESLPSSICKLKSLQDLDLSGCFNLQKLPDELGNLESLEELSVGETAIVELPSSIGCLYRLRLLHLNDCQNIKNLPSSLCKLKSLVILNLNGCFNLQILPDELGNLESLEKLYVAETAVAELPSSIGCLSRLRWLHLDDCKFIKNLPSNLCKLKSLATLNLNRCSNLQSLPNELGNLESLRELSAEGTAVTEVPSSIVYLNNLQKLSFNRCNGDKKMGFLMSIISLPLDGLHSLKCLKLIDCGVIELPESLGQLPSLRELYLDKNDFERMPPSIIHLRKLKYLSISDCKRLRFLPDLPCQISDMKAHGCSSLEVLSSLSFLFPTLSQPYKTFDFRNCLKLESDELNQVVKDAPRKFHELMDSMEERFYALVHGRICFPGSKIPEWFCYKGSGSSITLQLPPGWTDKFVGFRFCAIASFQDLHYINWYLKVCCEGKRKTEGRHCNDAGFFDFYVATNIHDLRSDHVFLEFCFDEYWFSESYENEVVFQFYLESRDHKMREYDAVKKCGVDLLYAEEEEETHPERQKI